MAQNLFNFCLKSKQLTHQLDLINKITKILHSLLKDWIGTKIQQIHQTSLKVISLIFRTTRNLLPVKQL
jgi:hypothetical protein